MKTTTLKQVGLKVTLPRIKVLDILQENLDQHLSAEDVYKQLLEQDETIGLATVYRVLTQLEGAGLVKRHHFEGGQAVFELDEGDHHDHIKCLDCGRVEEFMDETIEQRQRAIAQSNQFELADHSLILYAHCKRQDCPYRLET